jgi:16S rRNA G1207 methylase RsmC
MRTDLHSGLPAGLQRREQVDTGTRIEQIVRAMAVVQKQITALHKQLENTGDLAVRMQIRDEIRALQEMLETMRQQILMLTQMEERRKQMREHNTAS